MKALEQESNFPVGWGNKILNIADFSDFLEDEFMLRYSRRTKEYSVPVTERVFCQHLLPVDKVLPKGAMAPAPIYVKQDPGSMGNHISSIKLASCGAIMRRADSSFPQRCWRCYGQVCSTCGHVIISPGQSHTCAVHEARVAQISSDLVRGRDYQLCPNPKCQYPWALEDGCNHIVCHQSSCKTNFCFICGKEALERSGHWNVGMPCPRWNQPGTGNATFDAEEPYEPPWDGVELFHSPAYNSYRVVAQTGLLLYMIRDVSEEQFLADHQALNEVPELGEVVIQFRGIARDMPVSAFRNTQRTMSFLRNTNLAVVDWRLRDVDHPEFIDNEYTEAVWNVLETFFRLSPDIARQATARIVHTIMEFDYRDIEEPGGSMTHTARRMLSDGHSNSIHSSEEVERFFSFSYNNETSLGCIRIDFPWLLRFVATEHVMGNELVPGFLSDIGLRHPGMVHVHYNTRASLHSPRRGDIELVSITMFGQPADVQQYRINQLQWYLNRRYDLFAGAILDLLLEAINVGFISRREIWPNPIRDRWT